MRNLINLIKSKKPLHHNLENPSGIYNKWFSAHFNYAADVIASHLKDSLHLPSSSILNFGCGDGISDLGLMLRHGTKRVHGVDIRSEFEKLLPIAKQQIGIQQLPSGLTFENIQPAQKLSHRHCVDAIISWSTFEHVQNNQLEPILQDLFDCLRSGGVFFLQIEPLYFSPWGSHLRRYISSPWAHLLNDEDFLWKQIQQHNEPLNQEEVDYGFHDLGPDGYKNFVFEEYKKLNRLTVNELTDILESTGFSIEKKHCNLLEMEPPPFLLEKYSKDTLLTNEIILLLQKP